MADELDIIAFRRALHRRPELSFRETGTHDLIARTLDGLGIAHRTVARTGVLARIEGRGDLRRAVVLRADIDALPIREQADVAWRSLNDGVMHACGHDVHTAVLMGALQELNRSRDFEGTLLGLFQPGEECNPGGASLVLAEEPFADYDVRAVVGEHVEPSLEVGTFGFRAGKYMASSDELRFTVHGTGGHAALRNQLRDPVAAAAELVGGLIALNLPERVLSIGRIEADGATNVVPDDVRLEGTLRTLRRDPRHRRLHRPPVRHTDGRRHRAGLSLRGQRPRPRLARPQPGRRAVAGRRPAAAHDGRRLRVLHPPLSVAVLPAGRRRGVGETAYIDLLARREGHHHGHSLHAGAGPQTVE